MNIIEAIKSGENFRRSTYHKSVWVSKGCVSLTIDKADILADDWEVEEKKAEITRTQLERAYAKVLKHNSFEYRVGAQQEIAALAKELGLD